MKFITLVERFLDILFPLQCCGCERFGALVCTSCGRIPFARNTEELACTLAPFSYEDARIQRIIHRVKYNGEWALCREMAKMTIRALSENARWPLPSSTLLIPVPLHPARFAERGFNQSEKFARALGQELGWPVLGALERTVHTSQQAHLSKTERAENVRGAFRLARSLPRSTPVILVDDVVTTGATLMACRAAFPRPQQVTALAFAHQPSREGG